MFKPDSPFMNFPRNLDRRQAFYFDGIRHAFEIIDHAYSRLTTGLTELAMNHPKENLHGSYAHYYLDAWAFVDALDRLLALWKLQPRSESIPPPWNPDSLRDDMRRIRDIRNVSDHLAQRADEIISSNTAALGELSWVTVLSIEPPVMKSCFIRPGFLPSSVKFQMNLPKEKLFIKNSSGNVLLKAHTHTANISEAYERILGLANYAESDLKTSFESADFSTSVGGDLFASCYLDFQIKP